MHVTSDVTADTAAGRRGSFRDSALPQLLSFL